MEPLQYVSNFYFWRRKMEEFSVDFSSDYQGSLELYTYDHSWTCEIFGMGGEITVHAQNVPCWFWRKMQYLCFGNKWIRVDK